MSVPPGATPPPPPPETGAEDSRILTSSAIMAAGTAVSRMSGFVRSALLVAALGGSLHADLFTMANTVPNMVYILVAGGVMNAVLVPQLVRSMKHDPDGGEAYTNRIVTLAVVFLGAVTVLLVVAAPWVMDLYLNSAYDQPELAEQRESVIAFARYCLPQVFFYGMFVLAGQILNSRGRFGPMMWAPIANNVIAVGVLVAYLVAFGPATSAEETAGYTSGQELLLGVGSTLGIVVQFLILVPYLRSVGFRFRPRFDLRGTGLGHTGRLAIWTVLFVVVNQVAYSVVVWLASGGSAAAVDGGPSSGYTVYSLTFLVVMVPHSIVTVSLATALLPRLSRLAADDDPAGLASTLGMGMRTALAVAVPFGLLLPVVADDLAHVTFGYGAGRDEYDLFAPSLALFGIGLVFFTVHYLTLRGFYALERNRTVFFVQCGVAATNIVAAIGFVALTGDEGTAPALVLAYAASYAVGSVASYALLRRLLGGLETPRLVRFLGRLALAAVPATGVAVGLALLLGRGDADPSLLEAALRLVVVTVVDIGVFLGLARLLGIDEVTAVLRTVTGRMASRRGGTTTS